MEVAGLAVGVIALTDPIIKLAKIIRRRRDNISKRFQESSSKLVKNTTRIQTYCDRILSHCDEFPEDDPAEMKRVLGDVTQRLQGIEANLVAVIPQGERLNYSEYSKIKEALLVANSQASDCENQLADELEIWSLQLQARQRFALRRVTSEVRYVQADQKAILTGVDAIQSRTGIIHKTVEELTKARKPTSCLVHVGLLGHWRGKLERYDLTPDSSIGDIVKLELKSRQALPDAPFHFFAVYPRYHRCTAQGISWVQCDHTMSISSIERKSIDIDGQKHPIRLEYTPQSNPFSLVSVFGQGFDEHAVAIGGPTAVAFDLDRALKSQLKWPSHIEELRVINRFDINTGDPLDNLGVLREEYWIPFCFTGLCLEIHVAPPIPGSDVNQRELHKGLIAKCADFCFSLFD